MGHIAVAVDARGVWGDEIVVVHGGLGRLLMDGLHTQMQQKHLPTTTQALTSKRWTTLQYSPSVTNDGFVQKHSNLPPQQHPQALMDARPPAQPVCQAQVV